MRSKNGGAIKERYEYMTKTIVAAARRLVVLLYTRL
jgi:hypothetical protein